MRIDRSRRGNTILEAAMLIPVIVLLLVGMAQIGKVTYTYYTLRKTVYSVASYLSEQQGVNFCDAGDLTIAAAKNFGLTGTTDGTQPAFVGGLTADMIQVTAQRYDPALQSLGTCSCDVTGCDAAAGGTAPDYIVVSIPNGYQIQVRIPLIPQTDPILLKPMVKVHYGGT
jgi:Flp pilus assembly protein TadG